MLFMNRAIKEQLEQALVKLGWERYQGDLWRNRKSGIIAGFLDVIVMELQISVQEKKPFQGRYFKEPVEFSGKPEDSVIWMSTLVSYFNSVLRKLKSLLTYVQ